MKKYSEKESKKKAINEETREIRKHERDKWASKAGINEGRKQGI